MGLLATADTGAARVATAATTLAQLALICLGVHLAADRLDDLLFYGLTGATDLAEAWLAAPMASAAAAVTLDRDAFALWRDLPLALIAAWCALIVELAAIALLSGAILLTARAPEVSWAQWTRAMSIGAVVMPLTMAGVLLAGAWSLAMAAEDLLPPGTASTVAAGLVGVAAFARYGSSAWRRAVGALDAAPRWRQGWATALVLLPVGALAWRYGLPVWGWMP